MATSGATSLLNSRNRNNIFSAVRGGADSAPDYYYTLPGKVAEMSKKDRREHIFFRFQEYISLLMFAIMCVLMVLQLLSRYVFSSPLLFTEEFSRLCYVWVAFLGMAIGHHRMDHIKIELFSNMLPPSARKYLIFCVDLLCIAFLAYLGWWGIEYMIFNQWNVAASVNFPLYYVYASLPVGALLGIINIICTFFSHGSSEEGV